MKRLLTAATVLAIVALCAGCVTTATDQLDKGWAADVLGWATSWAESLDEDEVRDLWDQAERLRDIIEGKIPLPVVPVNTNVAAVLQDQRAEFLYDNAAGPQGRGMNALWLGATPEATDALIARMKAGGCNTAWLFLHNERDGSPLPTTFYQGDSYAGEVDQSRLEHVQRILTRFRAAGLAVVGWMTADDGGQVLKADRAAHLRHVERCIELVPCDEYVVGLEMDEDGRKNHAQAMIAHAKTLTDKRVGVHLGANSWQNAVTWQADVLYYQYGFGQSPSKCAAETVDVLGKVNGRCAFVGAEYHKSSDSAAARAIGDAIAAIPGVQGTGNGRSVQ